MGQQNAKSALSIKIISTQTQSQELFDYHQSTTEFQQKIIKSPTFIVTDGETVKAINQQNQSLYQQSIPTNTIFKVTLDDFQQIKIQHLGTQSNKSLWRVIRQGEMYPIKIGDTFKIGKIKIKLKKIVGQKNQRVTEENTDQEQVEIPLKDDTKSVNSNLSEMSRCRICFGYQNDKNDPLICLCKCSGSIKFIHFQCLRDWVLNSITKRQDENYKFYAYHDLICQLCKDNIPTNFRHQGKQYSFFDVNLDPPYAEFGSQEIDEDGLRKYHKYIIKLQEHKEILLGRNNTCQVQIKDISVSRIHCSLQYKHGSLLVRDKKSKFGTLIRVEKSMQFNLQHGLKLQFESTLIELYKKNRLKGCCCSDTDNFKLVYQVDEKQTVHSSKVQKKQQTGQQPEQNQQFQQVQFQYNLNNIAAQTMNQLLQTTDHLQTHRQTIYRNTQARNGITRY